jgi:hypothetical protein
MHKDQSKHKLCYKYIYIYTGLCIHMYVYGEREREKARERERERESKLQGTLKTTQSSNIRKCCPRLLLFRSRPLKVKTKSLQECNYISLSMYTCIYIQLCLNLLYICIFLPHILWKSPGDSLSGAKQHLIVV